MAGTREEWIVEYRLRMNYCVVTAGGEIIQRHLDEPFAQQVAREHNAHWPLVDACEAVLRDVKASVADMEAGRVSAPILPTTVLQVRLACNKANSKDAKGG